MVSVQGQSLRLLRFGLSQPRKIHAKPQRTQRKLNILVLRVSASLCEVFAIFAWVNQTPHFQAH